jgi:K+-transporting ATPase A subunit
MHLLYHRKTPGRTTLLVLTALMALLATVQFSLHVATTSLALRLLRIAVTDGQSAVPLHPTGVEQLYWSLVLTQDIVLVTNTSVLQCRL